MQKYIKFNQDALLITNRFNIYYLTGFSRLSVTEREAYVLLTKDKFYLFTSALYIEHAKEIQYLNKRLKNYELEVIEISRINPLVKKLKNILQKLGIKKLEFEKNDLTVSEFLKLTKELKGILLVPTQNRIEDLRKFKTPDEINHIRKACRLTDECFDYILKELKIGVTEAEIAWDIESFFRKKGAGIAFSPIVAFGKNSSQPHYSPSANCELRTANLVLLDFGARVSGYCADMTRVVFIGNPRRDWIRVYEVVLKAQQSTIRQISNILTNKKNNSGISGAELDRKARKIITEAGYPPYPHSLGHSLGLEIHESPRLTYKKNSQLLNGMVFTLEPAIYIEGKFGIRIEDLVCIQQYKMLKLSQSKTNPVILNL